MSEIVADRFLGGRLVLRQPAAGYRAGADALLLAAAVEEGARLMEAGCGAGAALLAVALRWPQTRLVGVEREPAMAALARENVAANGLDDRIVIEEADVLAGGPPCDGVFCNPPYAEPGEGTAPSPSREHSHVSEASLDRWIAALSNRLAGGAALTLIHRAERLDRILAALDGRLGDVTVLPVRPRAEAPAHRVLVRARKGSRAPLKLLHGLDLHDDSGAKFTPLADAIFRGEAAIAW
jgi:tRNA1(Val) A37 N6-methylase TrmN6